MLVESLHHPRPLLDPFLTLILGLVCVCSSGTRRLFTALAVGLSLCGIASKVTDIFLKWIIGRHKYKEFVEETIEDIGERIKRQQAEEVEREKVRDASRAMLPSFGFGFHT